MGLATLDPRWPMGQPGSGRKSMAFQLLGPVEVRGRTGPATLGGPKQRTVLAALLLNANRVVAEDLLTLVTWGESPPNGARGQLQLYVSRLRKVVGDHAIVRRATGYQIEVRPGE